MWVWAALLSCSHVPNLSSCLSLRPYAKSSQQREYKHISVVTFSRQVLSYVLPAQVDGMLPRAKPGQPQGTILCVQAPSDALADGLTLNLAPHAIACC